MKPEELVTCFETSKLLQDAGFIHDTYFKWCVIKCDNFGNESWELLAQEQIDDKETEMEKLYDLRIAAPTTDELLAMPEIPDDTFLTKHIDGKGRIYYAVTSLSNNVEGDIRDRAVEAAADYWLKVKEAK